MNVPDLIAQSKQDAEAAKVQLLKTFGFVPDDKLQWSPSPTARTPLWIVGHCGVANKAFAIILRGEEIPIPSNPAELAEQIRYGGKDTPNREAAVQLIEESFAEVVSALDKVTPAMVETSPNSPLGPLPFTFWMSLPSLHMRSHVPQIDYLQTIWGDWEDH